MILKKTIFNWINIFFSSLRQMGHTNEKRLCLRKFAFCREEDGIHGEMPMAQANDKWRKQAYDIAVSARKRVIQDWEVMEKVASEWDWKGVQCLGIYRWWAANSQRREAGKKVSGRGFEYLEGISGNNPGRERTPDLRSCGSEPGLWSLAPGS